MAEDLPATDVGRLVADHHAELYRYAYRLSGSAADAEDLTQQVFLHVQRKIHQLKDPAGARGWLFAILRNCFLAAHRRRTPLTAGSVDLDVDAIQQPVDSAAEIDREQLQIALNELPDEFRLVLLMIYFEDCSYREIAERLQLPTGTVMSRLSRAKVHLRKKLSATEVEGMTGPTRSRRSLASDGG